MGNENSSIQVNFKNLDDSSVQNLRVIFKDGNLKELPQSWNIFSDETKTKFYNLFKDQQGRIDQKKYIEFAGRHIGINLDDHVRLLCLLSSNSEAKPPIKLSNIKHGLMLLFKSLANTYSVKIPDEKLDNEVSKLSESLLHDIKYPSEKRKNTFGKEITGDEDIDLEIDQIEKLINENQLIEYAINQVLSTSFNIKQKYSPKAKIPVSESFLTSLQLLFLNHNIPLKFKNEWRPIFSTRKDGESFSKFAGLIINRGATVLIIRDNEGNIFGGFNSTSWKIGPAFCGSSDSFLFHLNPVMNIYESTPFNQNYQYFNMKQKTMPNGLGQGGQLEYFGYWIDSEFGRVVTSPSCTTYFSPQLGVKEGKIEELEVWGVGPEPDDLESGANSVLNMDPELQAVMEMMGKTFHSKAIREVDAREDQDEEE